MFPNLDTKTSAQLTWVAGSPRFNQPPDGKFETEIVQKVFENYGDRYAKDCVPGN